MIPGSAPPSPSPVTNRTAISSGTESTSGVSSVTTPNSPTATSRLGLRPYRSLVRPNRNAPISPPNSPMPNTRPNVAALTPQSAAMSGATRPIAWVSKPSIIATSAQDTITPSRNRPSREESSTESNPTGDAIPTPNRNDRCFLAGATYAADSVIAIMDSADRKSVGSGLCWRGAAAGLAGLEGAGVTASRWRVLLRREPSAIPTARITWSPQDGWSFLQEAFDGTTAIQPMAELSPFLGSGGDSRVRLATRPHNRFFLVR